MLKSEQLHGRTTKLYRVFHISWEKHESHVRRWSKQNSKYVTMKSPNVVGEYNRHMGGVDIIDSVMTICKIRLRSNRWSMRLFYHYLDLTMTNAWLLYKTVSKYKNISLKDLVALSDFLLEVADTFTKLEYDRVCLQGGFCFWSARFKR